MSRVLQRLYDGLLRTRRLRKLTEILPPYLPREGTVLDLGCGNGDVSAALGAVLPGVTFSGVDTRQVPSCRIPCRIYDGVHIPYPDGSFDYVMIITVLHHTDDYLPVLREARRVARKGIIIHDHQYETRLDWLKLALIDWPGNVPFGVYTPFNFKTRAQWQELYQQLDLDETDYADRIYFFGKSFDFLLGGRLHFISVLKKRAA